MSTIIKVENLSKQYIISHATTGATYTTLRDVMGNQITGLAGKFTRRLQKTSHNAAREKFWALKDVNFDLKEGERLGIIGKNGAGKTTLLKLLSRITEPTTGQITIRGRVASLLEVGTGFHPELTGKENIYLNGAILGMSKKEIRCKFDEIVDFSGVEKFLDTPVKRYSSGMQARLGFAVAAHLEPDILIVDEVLATGDASFQKKCLGKMESVSREGRTVLFVSHNMAMVQQLCEKTILLQDGRIADQGDTNSILDKYLESTSELTPIDSLDSLPRNGNLGLHGRFTDLCILNADKANKRVLRFGEPLEIVLKFKANRNIDKASFVVRFDTINATPVIASSSEDVSKYYPIKDGEEISVRIYYAEQFFIPGRYNLTISCRDGNLGVDQLVSVSSIEVVDVGYEGVEVYHASWGVYNLKAKWS